MNRPAPLFAPLPYFAAFIAAPVALLAGRLAGKPALGLRFGLDGLALWATLAALAALASLFASARSRAGHSHGPWLTVTLACALSVAGWALTKVLSVALAQTADYAPLLDELRLPALVGFAALWIWSFGAPRRESLAQAGAVLGALSVLDFLLTAITAKSVVAGGGLLLGNAPGTTEAVGCLLAVSLCATLDDEPVPGQPRLARWLILAGLLASGSRTGLAAGAVLCLFLERGRTLPRAGMALACTLAIWIGMLLPLQRMAPTPSEELGLGWYLAATTEAMRQDPVALATGLALDVPMAEAMPELQGAEEDEETEGLPVSVFQIPSSLLRLFAGWGVGGPLLALGAALFCALRGRRRFGYGLLAVLALCGGLATALHTPATAATLALAFISAARRAQTTGSDADPAAPRPEPSEPGAERAPART